jgi:hypothetical protein
MDVDGERAEVAIVHAHDSGACGDRHVELVGVVDLNQRVESELAGATHQDAQHPRCQRRHDEQDRIRARGGRLEQLVRRYDEILPQHRHVNRLANRDQMIE